MTRFAGQALAQLTPQTPENAPWLQPTPESLDIAANQDMRNKFPVNRVGGGTR